MLDAISNKCDINGNNFCNLWLILILFNLWDSERKEQKNPAVILPTLFLTCLVIKHYESLMFKKRKPFLC